MPERTYYLKGLNARRDLAMEGFDCPKVLGTRRDLVPEGTWPWRTLFFPKGLGIQRDLMPEGTWPWRTLMPWRTSVPWRTFVPRGTLTFSIELPRRPFVELRQRCPSRRRRTIIGRLRRDLHRRRINDDKTNDGKTRTTIARCRGPISTGPFHDAI